MAGVPSAAATEGPPPPVILPAGASLPEPVDPNAKPAYPDMARTAGFEGEVIVKVIVHADGHVELVKVITIHDDAAEQ